MEARYPFNSAESICFALRIVIDIMIWLNSSLSLIISVPFLENMIAFAFAFAFAFVGVLGSYMMHRIVL